MSAYSRACFTRLKGLAGVFVLPALFMAEPAHAGLVAIASYNDISTPNSLVDLGTSRGNAVYASVGTMAGGRAVASAGYGVLKGTTIGSTTGGGSSGGTSAKFDDLLRLSNSTLNGAQGTVTVAYQIDYDSSVTAAGTGFSNGSVSFLARAGSNYSWYLDYLRSDGGSYTMYEFQDGAGYGRTYGVPRANFVYVTTDFTWGGLFGTSFELNTNASSDAPGDGSGSAGHYFDAGHSAYWAGIVSATANGQVIRDYTLTSQSGTDYSRSFAPAAEVPEPATSAMFLFGLAVVGMLRKRMNQK